jgi:hypothetical protein
MVIAAVEDERFVDVLERDLWSRVAADEAEMMLDHVRGEAAAHCCMRATVADWVRLALLIAEDGATPVRQLWSQGFLGEITRASPVHEAAGLGMELHSRPQGQPLLALRQVGRAVFIDPESRAVLLWVGDGQVPDGLETLLATP